LHEASLKVAVGTHAAGEVLDRRGFGLRVAIDHGSDTEFLIVGVAHLGGRPVCVEVHD
jgi:hypothetical protein